MIKYQTDNGLIMVRCFPLNWQVQKTYAIDTDSNPEFYTIHVGSISDMWQASFLPDKMIVTFTSMHYSNHEVYKFKVDSIREASELVLKFAKGMNQLDNLLHTIYWN